MAEPPQPKPAAPKHASDLAAESPDGVDLTLIHWTLSLTPLERLELLQDWVDGLAELRRGRTGGALEDSASEGQQTPRANSLNPLGTQDAEAQ